MSNENSFVIENGILVQFNGTAAGVVIPEGVSEVGIQAFENAKKLKSITIPEGVVKIGWQAFKGCTALTSVSIPESVEKIDSQAFSNCTKLEYVSIPNENARAVGAFENCRALSYIQASETTMQTVFRQAGDKLKIQLAYGYLSREDTSAEYDAVAKWFKKKLIPIIIENDNAFAMSKLFSMYKRPIKINDLDEYLSAAQGKPQMTAFLMEYKGVHYSGEQVEKQKTNDTEKELGLRKRTLAEWRKLFVVSSNGDSYMLEKYKGTDTSVEVPDIIGAKPVEELEYTFAGCADVCSVTLPEGLKIIGWNVFEGTSITEMVIPASVESIGMFAFTRCENLQRVLFKAPADKEIEIDEDAFSNCPSVVLSAAAGGCVEKFAKDNHLRFVPVE